MLNLLSLNLRGTVSALLKRELQPLTPEDLNMKMAAGKSNHKP